MEEGQAPVDGVASCGDVEQDAIDSRIQELEQLLRQSAQWGQYLVNRNEELEAELMKVRSQRTGPADDELQTQLSDALLRADELEEEVHRMKLDMTFAQRALEMEQSSSSTLRSDAQRMRRELEERQEEEELESSARHMRVSLGNESAAGEDGHFSLADELGILSSGSVSGPSAPKEAWHAAGEEEESEEDSVNCGRGGEAIQSSNELVAKNTVLREENRRLIAELERLRTARKVEDSAWLPAHPHLAREISDSSTPNRRPSEISNSGTDEFLEADMDACGQTDESVTVRQQNGAIRRECRQLRKEVAGAEEWERRARKTTEAKQGLLKLHEALLKDPKATASEGGSAVTSGEVQKLREAVVRAADAEAEARELLAAKQEMLAEEEARLRESDQKCLREVVTSVKSAFRQPTGLSPCAASPGSKAVWHVMLDSV